MRIAVCDDDELELSHLLGSIAAYGQDRGEDIDCRSFHSGMDLLCSMKGGEYDLIILDVLMPGIGGIQAAQEIRMLDENVKLIFISTTPASALESYSVGAYHYLVKPIDDHSLFPLLDKVMHELSLQDEQSFVLKDRKGVVRISFARIEYVEVINKRVSFHLTDGAIREVTAALADLEGGLLSRPGFVKPHRSYLVNLDHVQLIDIKHIVTINGHIIPISRQHRSQIQDAYMHFLTQKGTVALVPGAQATEPCAEPERPDGPWRILLVDDDPADRCVWADILRYHGCIVHPAGNGEEALELISNGTYDCVLLDVMIPGDDGFSICERLHALTHAPIIFLSCLTEPDKQIDGFAAGGVDYITKDTPAGLFWAKVETRIRLTSSDRTQASYGPLLLDRTGKRVLLNEKELPFTSIEFDLLWYLSEHADHIFTLRELSDAVWRGQPWDGGQTVQMHMSRLRRKLEKAWGAHHFIETVWGQGYRFVPEHH